MIGSNAIAPSAVVAGDYALGTKDYADAGDALTDATLGTFTNLAMNRVAYPLVTNALSVGLARTPRMRWVADAIEGTKTDKQKALDIINDAENKVRRHFGETNAEYLQKLRNGKTPDRLSDDQLKDYIDILNARDAVGNKDVADALTEYLKRMR
jgi:hypothetical protein